MGRVADDPLIEGTALPDSLLAAHVAVKSLDVIGAETEDRRDPDPVGPIGAVKFDTGNGGTEETADDTEFDEVTTILPVSDVLDVSDAVPGEVLVTGVG